MRQRYVQFSLFIYIKYASFRERFVGNANMETLDPTVLPRSPQHGTTRKTGGERMKIRRKFNLQALGKPYETLDIEVEHDTAKQCLEDIQVSWRIFQGMLKADTIQ